MPLDETASRSVDDHEVTSLGFLDLRAASARLEYHDGDPTLFVSGGDSEIEFTSGLGGAWSDAITGAHELAAVALSFADALRAHRPKRSVPAGPAG